MNQQGENSDFGGVAISDDNGNLHFLRSVSAYRSAYELLHNETYVAEEESEDFLDFLRHVDDWETISYFCINGDSVLFCDSINGQVLAFCQIWELLDDLREHYKQFCEM